MMNLLSGLLLLTLTVNGPVEHHTSENDLIGNWYGEEMDRSYFRIEKNSNNQFTATIYKSDKPEYVGKVILQKAIYDAEENHWKGTLSPPNRNITIKATISLEPNESAKVVGKKMFITKTFYWQRVE